MVKQKQIKKPVSVQVKPRKTIAVRWFSLVLVVLTVILYFNTLQNGYVLDDKGIITENKFTLKGFSGIPDLLTSSYWEGVGINVRSYRPLAPVTFAAEVGYWGTNPAAGHFFNLVIYIVTGLVLFFFLKRLFHKIDPGLPAVLSFIVAGLFLAHPIHTEVVANIKGRDSMLELLFLLSSGLFFLKFLLAGKRSDLLLSVVLFFPALLSKESAITYVVMVPVMFILFDRRPFLKQILISALYLIPVAIFLVLYFSFSGIQEFRQLHLLDNSLLAEAPASNIWATKFLILGKYLALLIYPHPLVYDYSYNQVPMAGFSDLRIWISLMVYIAAVVYLLHTLFGRLKGRKISTSALVTAFSVAWFIMGFFASSNLFMLIGSTMGERFMYTPSVGFMILLVYGMYRLPGVIPGIRVDARKGLAVLFFLCAGLLVAYTLKTTDRNKAWKDDFTLFSTDLRYLGENAKANDFLGNLYRKTADTSADGVTKRENYLKAIELKEKALGIYPKVPEIQQQLAFLYGNTGQWEKAVATYKVAIEMNPGEVMNYVQIGKALGMMRRSGEALEFLKKGEGLHPGHAELLATLGITCAQTGETVAAIGYFEKALALDPSNKQIAEYLIFAKNQPSGQRK